MLPPDVPIGRTRRHFVKPPRPALSAVGRSVFVCGTLWVAQIKAQLYLA
jgi:hypothetical protein